MDKIDLCGGIYPFNSQEKLKQFEERLAEERHNRLEERKRQRKEERKITYYREKEEEEQRRAEEQMLKGIRLDKRHGNC